MPDPFAPRPDSHFVVAPGNQAFDRTMAERIRAAAEYFWRQGHGEPERSEADIAQRLDDLLGVTLGSSSGPTPAWVRRRDLFGDGVNAFDIAWSQFRPDLIPRLGELLGAQFPGFSVALFFYEDDLGAGAPRSGALWLDRAGAVVTQSLWERLQPSLQKR